MASIKLRFDFSDMLEAIKDAGGDVDRAAERAADECAQAMHSELVAECNASGVPASVSGAVTHEVKKTAGGNEYVIEAGWKMGAYDPNNPSAGHKAAFLNYGTARRSTNAERVRHAFGGGFVTLGKDRGAIAARGFIARAKKGASKKVKKIQKEALKSMLKELT